MKKLTFYLMLLVTALLITACHRNDIRTESFQIGQLRTQESIQLIAKALQQLQGIQEIQPDVEKHTLTVIFDGRTLYVKNIEYAIVKAGFSLPNWPANPADVANLPAELQ